MVKASYEKKICLRGSSNEGRTIIAVRPTLNPKSLAPAIARRTGGLLTGAQVGLRFGAWRFLCIGIRV